MSTRTNEGNDLLAAALALAERGKAVFPVAPGGKRPAIPSAHTNGDRCPGGCGRDGHGVHDATCDVETIRGWWALYPSANVGLATGGVSGVDVLDVDVAKRAGGPDGRATLAALEAEHGTLPPTVAAATPSGGRHLFFAHLPGLTSRVNVAPGLDVRADGGYVVVAPSALADGTRYVWDPGTVHQEVAAWPEWLANLARPSARPAPSTPSLDAAAPSGRDAATRYGHRALAAECEAVAGCPEGSRNDTLNRAAFAVGQLVGGGEIDNATATARLAAAATEAGLGPREAALTIASGLSAGRDSPRSAPPRSPGATWGRGPTARGGAEARNAPSDGDRPTTSTTSIPAPVDDLEDPWVPFPVDSLPAVVGDWVRTVAKVTRADPAVPASAALACAAAHLGNAFRLQVQDGYDVPPNIWVAIVAESGTGKSPALRLAWSPMDPVEAPHHADFKRAWSRYVRDVQRWRDTPPAERDEEPPEEPEDTRLIVGDATGEALVDLLARRARGCLIADSELRSVLEGVGAYKNGRGNDESWLLKAYDGERIQINRKNLGPVGKCAERPLLSIVGAMTPNIAKRVFGGERAESGMTGRFLVVSPPTSPALVSNEQIDTLASAQFGDALTWLRALDVPRGDQGQPMPAAARFSPTAREVFRETSDGLAWDAIAERGVAASVTAKARGLCARLSLVIHALRCAAGEQNVDGSALALAVVDDTSTRIGCAVAEWYARETLRVVRPLLVNGETLKTSLELAADALDAWARDKRQGEPITVADAVKNAPAALRRASNCRAAIASLVASGRWGVVREDRQWRPL